MYQTLLSNNHVIMRLVSQVVQNIGEDVGDSFPPWPPEDRSVPLARMFTSAGELLRLLGDAPASVGDETSWVPLPPTFSERGRCLQMLQLIESRYAEASRRLLTNMPSLTAEPNPDSSSAWWLKSRLERVAYLLVVVPAVRLGRLLGSEQLAPVWPDTGVDDEWPEMSDTTPGQFEQDSNGAVSPLCESYFQLVGEGI